MSEEVRRFPRGRLILVVAAIAAIAAAVTVTTRSGGGSRRALTPKDEVYVKMMKSDIRGVAAAENLYRRQTGGYTADLEKTSFLQTVGVNLPKVTVVDSGFTVVVTHSELPGMRCGMGVFADNPVQRGTASGEIICK